MSRTLAKLGLKFTKEKPEAFSKYLQVVGIDCEVKLQQEQYELLLREIRSSKPSQKEIVEPILSKMTELAQSVKDVLEQASKVKSSQLKEPRDLSKEIEALLATKNELTFSNILDELHTTAPTLTSHLDKLVSQNMLERSEIGRNVVYRLKRGE